ncbi:MAG: dTDP-4-amino-4,6-dideoxygalactose transaminase [Calditrichaceae bacterium]|nr:dTDP-4-amino-4,6-dideoxygalactose transaminase [Calditrichaceae bacterium]MBN2710269.1 dTDP-4-amino-4,6-dideoxygalactose transaminase [Calditrichaceae bacterium]RQV93890.1 MAG: dTDP-4-amino-4,6-dideoxygalactose transaminase [Calditrichota bacterium]
MKIPFNKPYVTGKEIRYIKQAIASGKISGNGDFTKKCQNFLCNRYKFQNCLLTTSCTTALEMSAILIDIKPGDEVIIPSFTFVSSALAFERQGAKIVFCDSRDDHPGLDEKKIERLITNRTKAIVVVHYAGIACDMDLINSLALKYNLYLIEDAAQAIDSTYKGVPLGQIGHFGCFSFHETKNIQCGEGGLLVINEERFNKRAEIIWEKGTNRAEFFRGEVNKYSWVDIGSSFLPSDITAAFLYAQLEKIDEIQEKRINIWQQYYEGLLPLAQKGIIQLPVIPHYAKNNAHMFYFLCSSLEERSALIKFLKSHEIGAVFHYLSLHSSPYYSKKYQSPKLPFADMYSDRLLRLPFYFELSKESIHKIIKLIRTFYKQ